MNSLSRVAVSIVGRSLNRTKERWLGSKRVPRRPWKISERTNGAASVTGLPVIKAWDDGVIMRQMGRHEIVMATKINAVVGTVGVTDLDLLYKFSEPPGKNCWIFEVNGEVAGMGYAPEVAHRVFPSGGGYVFEKYRKDKIGQRLGEQIQEVVKETGGRTIGCATSKSIKILQRVGYKHKYNMLPFQGVFPSVDGLPEGIIKASDIPLEKIIGYDNKIVPSADFPVRRKMLQAFHSIEGGACFVAIDENSDVVGMAYRRPALPEGLHFVGPFYADNYDIGERLLLALGLELPSGDKVECDVYDFNEDAIRLFQKYELDAGTPWPVVTFGGDFNFNESKLFCITSNDVMPF